MNRRLVLHACRLGAALLAFALAGCARYEPPHTSAAHGDVALPHWGYASENGPAEWGKLDARYATCGIGLAQSPIDILNAVPTSQLPNHNGHFQPAGIRIVRRPYRADVVNNGHAIQVNYVDGDTLAVGSDAYALKQYHFHSPSEHQVAGTSFPMEMHLVHKSADGRLAVVGVLIREGQRNAAFDPVWSRLPATKGATVVHDSLTVTIDDLLPSARTAYRYDGSLTTPPCSEGVKWLVLTTPIELSPSQIIAFRRLIVGNNRPVQPLYGRSLAEDVLR
jgi:carbonic anhydrase